MPQLPLHHGDPFDRMLIAQASIESLTLLTADQRLKAYGIPLLLAKTEASWRVMARGLK